MLKLIKTFIGKLTSPEEVYVCSLGDYWVEVDYIPDYDVDWRSSYSFLQYPYKNYSHLYSYQQIEQNWYGRWVKKSCWLGKNTPLKLKGD